MVSWMGACSNIWLGDDDDDDDAAEEEYDDETGEDVEGEGGILIIYKSCISNAWYK